MGDKVGMSEATLLNMLNISPFTYGLIIVKVYDSGTIFDPFILDITDEELRQRFMIGVRNVAALSLKVGIPTMASAPHSLVNGMKNLLAVAAAQGVDVAFAEFLSAKLHRNHPAAYSPQLAEELEQGRPEEGECISTCSQRH